MRCRNLDGKTAGELAAEKGMRRVQAFLDNWEPVRQAGRQTGEGRRGQGGRAAGGADGDNSAVGVQMGVSLEEREKIVQQAAQDPFAHVEQDPVIRQQVRPTGRQAGRHQHRDCQADV